MDSNRSTGWGTIPKPQVLAAGLLWPTSRKKLLRHFGSTGTKTNNDHSNPANTRTPMLI
jgi:hypothetical protein